MYILYDRFTIELLQHKFEQNFQKIDVDDSFALGQPAVIGQITTRSTNIEVGDFLFVLFYRLKN